MAKENTETVSTSDSESHGCLWKEKSPSGEMAEAIGVDSAVIKREGIGEGEGELFQGIL